MASAIFLLFNCQRSEVTIDVEDDDYNYLDDEELLDILTEREIENFLDEVYQYIIDINEFEDADISGDISGIEFDYLDGSLNIEY